MAKIIIKLPNFLNKILFKDKNKTHHFDLGDFSIDPQINIFKNFVVSNDLLYLTPTITQTTPDSFNFTELKIESWRFIRTYNDKTFEKLKLKLQTENWLLLNSEFIFEIEIIDKIIINKKVKYKLLFKGHNYQATCDYTIYYSPDLPEKFTISSSNREHLLAAINKNKI